MKFLAGSWIVSPLHKKNSQKAPLLCSYKREILIEDMSSNYEIGISANSKYKCFVNDRFVSFGPQKGNHTEWFFDRLNLNEYLINGINHILITVLSYPAENRKGNHSLYRTHDVGLFVGALTQSTKDVGLYSDNHWKSILHSTEIYPENDQFAPLFIFEKAQNTISLLKYKEHIWDTVETYRESDLSKILWKKSLKERSIPFMTKDRFAFKEISRIRQSLFSKDIWNSFLQVNKKISIPPHTKEIIEISVGEETTAFLRLNIQNGQDTKITILTSESYAYPPIMKESGPMNPVKGDRTDSAKGKLYGFFDYYTVCGTNEEVYEPFWFRTFRYIQLEIETNDEEITLNSFDYIKTQYPLDVKSSVLTSDDSLSQIWEISERSLRCCMHETYEDCPFYEQLQYIMDSRSQILYTYAISMDDRLARRCMNDFKVSSKEGGLLNASFPNFEENIIPGFSLYYIGMLYDHMMYFGDKGFLCEHIETVLNIIKFYRNHLNEMGLVNRIGGPLFEEKYWSFIDWTQEWNPTIGVPSAIRRGPITMESLLYLMGLQYAIEIFDFIELKKNVIELKKDEQTLKSSLRRFCIDDQGYILDGPGVKEYSQHAQVFGILTGVINDKEGKEILNQTLLEKNKFVQCSVAMMFYLFRALEKCNLYASTNNLWGIWRDMLDKNLTTCEEDSVNGRSDCHAWGALALYEMPSVILGIQPYCESYLKIKISPQFGYLSWAKGYARTPHGTVHVNWSKIDDNYIVNVQCDDASKIMLDTTRNNVTYKINGLEIK